MVLVIDNYDSFTYNLVQYISEAGPEVEVYRNDEISVEEVFAKKPSHIVISPGPCTPNEAGISLELIKQLPEGLPLLGICLGHQAIGSVFGGKVIRAPYLMHGKVSDVNIVADCPIYKDVKSPFQATRYHSLIVESKGLPSELVVDSATADGIIMGFHHVSKPIFGLQFHPESIRTLDGKTLIKNFLRV